MMWSSAIFQLRAYYIFSDEDSPTRKLEVLKTYGAACCFIEGAALCCTTTQELPYPFQRTALAAAILISKVIHSSYEEYAEVERGKKAFNACISIFKQSCMEDNDMYGRATKILPQLWSIHARLAGRSRKPPMISIKSRLFFSIAHDGLWQWREEYADQPNNGAPRIAPPLISPSLAASNTTTNPDSQSPESFCSGMRVDTDQNPTPPRSTSERHHPAPLGTISNLATANGEHGFEYAVHQSTRMELGELGLFNGNALQFDLLFPDAAF
jgi:hypothetical protein